MIAAGGANGLKLTLVLGLGLHEVGTRADVGRVGALGDELEVQGIAAGGDAIGAGVIGAVDAALGGAAGGVVAVRGVPLVAVIAVGAAAQLVKPAPVGVDGDLALDVGARAASARALGPSERGVGLSGEGAHGLGRGGGHEAGEGSELGNHGGGCGRNDRQFFV